MPQWQPVVNPRGHLTDQASPEHQLVADNLGVSRNFLKCGKKKTGGAHKSLTGLAVIKMECMRFVVLMGFHL
jgi:hypothetical protein